MKDKHDKVTPDFPEVLRTEGRGSYPDMEGDWLWTEAECRVARDQAGHELHFHQTIVAFEELMHKHGLWALVDQMTQKGQDAFYAVIGDDR